MGKSSTSPGQTSSSPKGGGALRGIGETFSPDLFTGTGNFTVPIALPPGRNGFQPQLNLVYSTGNGQGAFGLGWGLSLPGVSRKTSHGVPRYLDRAPLPERDSFILSGAEDLVPVEDTATRTRYRPRTEGLFARIDHHHSAAQSDDYWEVRSKDGLVSYYGTTGRAGDDPATVADPANLRKVFEWKLSSTHDPFGNQIIYEYEHDTGDLNGRRWVQCYLKRIRYADYKDAQHDPQFLVAVTFSYEDRPDAILSYRSGFEIRTRRRCREIVVTTNADSEILVRAYRFGYCEDPFNGASLLASIQVVGFDDAGHPSADLPPLEFGYTQFAPQQRTFAPVTGSALPGRSLASPDLELLDLFGNGLPDILELNGTARYWRNLGGGRYDMPQPMPYAPAGVALADTGVQLLDANGDGRPDLLVTTATSAGYYPMRFGGLWDRRSFQRYRAAPGFSLEDPEVRLVDLDGDGVTDAVRSGARLECFFNDPVAGWDRTRWVERQTLDHFPNISFSDARVKWADMCGDGLQDIVLVHDGCVAYWPNLGHGNWGSRVTMQHGPRFPYGYDPRHILVGDVDGDGLADIVYVDHTRVTLWINRSGSGWSDPITIRGTPPLNDADAVRLVDLYGSGVSGVL